MEAEIYRELNFPEVLDAKAAENAFWSMHDGPWNEPLQLSDRFVFQKVKAKVEDLDFNYRIRGKEPFAPVRVFNDGRQTFVDLDPDYRGGMPVLVVDGSGGDEIVNTRINGLRYTVDAVFQRARLVLGLEGGEVVIERDR